MAASFLEKFRKKTLDCPNCKGQMRVPIRQGKTLRVTCPRCSTSFDIRFSNPLGNIIQWNRNLSFKENIAAMTATFRNLPKNAKMSVILLLGSVFLLIFMLFAKGNSSHYSSPSEKSPRQLPQNNDSQKPRSDLLNL